MKKKILSGFLDVNKRSFDKKYLYSAEDLKQLKTIIFPFMNVVSCTIFAKKRKIVWNGLNKTVPKGFDVKEFLDERVYPSCSND